MKWLPSAAAAVCLALAVGAGAPAAEAAASGARLRRLVPATLSAEAGFPLPEDGAVVSPALLEEGPVATRGCHNCRMDVEPGVSRDAENPEQMAEWAKHTQRRANNALRMLREISAMKQAPANDLDKDIAEDRNLLGLADKLKDHLVDVLGQHGVSMRLPSEHHTYVDATGMHWEDAHMWDDQENLDLQQYQAVRKDKDALRKAQTRAEIPQWHGSSENNRLINEKNPLRPVVVKRLQNSSPTPCAGGSCAKVKSVPVLPSSREQFEAETK